MQQTVPSQDSIGASLPSRQELLEHLLNIFTHHARQGDRLSGERLSSSNFIRLLEQAQIQLDRRQIDVLFRKIIGHKSHMTFDVFVSGIPDIAHAVFSRPESAASFFRSNSPILRRSPSPSRLRPGSPQKSRAPPPDLPNIAKLMQEHFVPHSQSLTDHTKELRWLHFNPPSQDQLYHTQRLLKAVESGLFDIYEGYFPWELKGTEAEYDELRVRSLKKLFLFINDFDLCPLLVNKTLAFKIWQSSLSNPPKVECEARHKEGIAFSFPKLLELLLKAAYIGFKIEEQMTLPERMYSMLSHMQLSKGLVIVESKKKYPHSSKTYLAPPKPLFQEILSDMLVSQGHKKPKKMLVRLDSAQSPLRQHTLESEALSRQLEQDIAASQIFLKWAAPLQSLFESYSAFGEPLNPHTLKSSKFMKLMRDAKITRPKDPGSPDLTRAQSQLQNSKLERAYSPLLKHFSTSFASPKKRRKVEDSFFDFSFIMTPPDCDLLFSKLTGRAQPKARFDSPSRYGSDSGRMDYALFLKAIEFIAQRKAKIEGSTFKMALDEVVEMFLLPLYHSNLSPAKRREASPERHAKSDEILSLMQKFKTKHMSRVLSILHRTLLSLFVKYTIPNSMIMDFQGFSRFCRDFQIFPDVLPKSRIMLFFHTLSKQNTSDLPMKREPSLQRAPSLSHSISFSFDVNKSKKHKTGQDKCIDQDLFTQAIGLCALESSNLLPPGEESSDDQKVIYLLERMSQSKGPGIVMRLYGRTRITPTLHNNKVYTCQNPHDLCSLFRQEMPELFPKALPPPAKNSWLDDIFKI